MNVYTKINGKLAMFEIGSEEYAVAIRTVRDEVRKTDIKHRSPILAVINQTPVPPQMEFNFD